FLLVDRVGQTALAPDINLHNIALVLADNLEELIQGRGNGALILRRIENDHEFVLTHGPHHLLWSSNCFRPRPCGVAGGSLRQQPIQGTPADTECRFPAAGNPGDLRDTSAPPGMTRCSPAVTWPELNAGRYRWSYRRVSAQKPRGFPRRRMKYSRGPVLSPYSLVM